MMKHGVMKDVGKAGLEEMVRELKSGERVVSGP